MGDRRLIAILQPSHRALRMLFRPLFVIRIVKHTGNAPLLHVCIAIAVLVGGLAHDNFDRARMLAKRVGFGPIAQQIPSFFTR